MTSPLPEDHKLVSDIDVPSTVPEEMRETIIAAFKYQALHWREFTYRSPAKESN